MEWVKPRKPPRRRGKVTPQQLKIAEAGKKIGEKCKGLKSGEFYACRHQVLEEIMKKPTVAITA